MNQLLCLDRASAMVLHIGVDLYQARQRGVPESALSSLLRLQSSIEDVRKELAREMFGDDQDRIAAELEASTNRTELMTVYSSMVH